MMRCLARRGAVLFRKQQRELKPQLPGRSVIRANSVVIGRDRCVVRLTLELEYAAKAATHRHRPLLAGRCVFAQHTLAGPMGRSHLCGIIQI